MCWRACRNGRACRVRPAAADGRAVSAHVAEGFAARGARRETRTPRPWEAPPVGMFASSCRRGSARSVAASYKPPMLVTRVRLPACAIYGPGSLVEARRACWPPRPNTRQTRCRCRLLLCCRLGGRLSARWWRLFVGAAVAREHDKLDFRIAARPAAHDNAKAPAHKRRS